MRRFRVIFAVVSMLLSFVLNVQAQSFDLPGHIAIVGQDFNVYVVGSEFATPTVLTSDASPTRHYQFPTWSTDGRLAFFCCDISVSARVGIEAYVASTDLTASKLIYRAENEGYTYAPTVMLAEN